jgi:hypothetical protein
MAVTRAFGDPDFTPDNFSQFSKQEVDADEAAKAEDQYQPVPTARSTVPMDLSNVLGSDSVTKIQSAGQIVFHTAGDTGGIEKPEFQFAVADAMANDLSSGPAFWYHLGDVVYFFGQDQYYFEQFYDPYRNYNAPIFAIPGNHDGAIFSGETARSLDAFVSNFCAETPGNSPDSQGAVRTTMDQPGVYFTLNAPFVKFIGLYSNTGEGGTQGMISGTKVGTVQLDFLKAQLTTAKQERAANNWRALVLATHHPPFTGSPFHVPSPDMLQQIDQICTEVGIWPDIHLSGHSHLYERYSRTINGKQIPYVVAGMAGYYGLAGLKPGNKVPPPKTPMSGTDASGNPLRMEVFDDTHFGFMRMTISAKTLTGVFVTVDTGSGATATGDSFTLDFATGTVANLVPASSQPAAAGSVTTVPAKKTVAKTVAPKKAITKMPAKNLSSKTPTKKIADRKPAAKASAQKASPKKVVKKGGRK